MREILNRGSGRDREDNKIVVMKWMIAVCVYVFYP